MNPTISKLYHEANLCIDMFGRELKVGDTVLCKGYGSLDKDTIASIGKINKTTINVNLKRRKYVRGDYVPRPDNHAGYWNYYPNADVITETKPMKRRPIDVMLISPEFKTEIESREDYLFQTYPEYFI